MKETEFLHKKFPDLNKSRDVQAAALRAKRRTGEEPPLSKPDARIGEYVRHMAAFKDAPPEGMQPKSQEQRETFMKKILFENTTRYEDIPESYWKSYEQNIIRATGQLGDWQTMNAEAQEQWKKIYVEPLLIDQRASLEEWLDYFLSDLSGDIPDVLKYWAFRSITQLQEHEKEEGETHIKFPRRSKGSVKKFPDLNPEALRYVVDALVGKFNEQKHDFEFDIQPDDKAAFEKSLAKEKFADLYAWAHEHFNPIPKELLPITDGEWRVYPKGSDVEAVAQTLRGRGTGLCIAGRGAAKSYLNTGDLLIYYSNDEQGNPVFPRAAIHMVGDKIAEVRGVAYKQNVDGYIADIVQNKLNEFPDGKQYQKKTDDMKALIAIEKKMNDGIDVTPTDLIFLYERDSTIQGFGMQDDPRIKELRKRRNPKEDAPIVLECASEEIAWSQEEFMQNPKRYKTYIGPLFDGMFKNYPNLEHIYTSFPEEKVREVPPVDVSLEIIQKTGREIGDMVETEGMNIHQNDRYMLENETPRGGYRTFEQTRLKKPETIHLVRLTVNNMFGDGKNHTTDAIYKKATDLGLELCPPEVGPLYRIAYKDQLQGEYLRIAMEQITDSDGLPYVFHLYHDDDGVWLVSFWAKPVYEWSPDRTFVFRLRK